jgi:hypothetical protein
MITLLGKWRWIEINVKKLINELKIKVCSILKE